MSETDEPKVKGVAFRSALAALDALHGEATTERAYAALAPSDAETIRYRIVQTGWYPISLYRALWAAIVAVCPRGIDDARALGAWSIRRDATGVYRFFFKVLSPETILAIGGRFFGQYYDTGKLEVTDQGHGRARVVYTGCKGFDRAIWEEVTGSSEEMIRLGGAKNVRVTVEKSSSDLSARTLRIEWS